MKLIAKQGSFDDLAIIFDKSCFEEPVKPVVKTISCGEGKKFLGYFESIDTDKSWVDQQSDGNFDIKNALRAGVINIDEPIVMVKQQP